MKSDMMWLEVLKENSSLKHVKHVYSEMVVMRLVIPALISNQTSAGAGAGAPYSCETLAAVRRPDLTGRRRCCQTYCKW